MTPQNLRTGWDASSGHSSQFHRVPTRHLMANKAPGLALLHDYQQKAVEEQAKIFLRTFVMDFRGNFDEILQLAERFITYRTRKSDDDANLVVQSLEEADLYRFLEAQGHPISASEFRAELRAIDIETDRNVSFIAYCIWHYKKTVDQLVIPPGEADPALIKILEEALAAYQKVIDARKARDQKMAQLNATIASGGVKGNIAKAELDQMLAADQLERNKAEITAAAKRRAAQKAVESDKDGAKARQRAMDEETKRLAAERKKKEEEEKRLKEEQRAKLKAKSAMFEQVIAAQAPPPVTKGAAPAKKWAPPSGQSKSSIVHPPAPQHHEQAHPAAPVAELSAPPAAPAPPPPTGVRMKSVYPYTANSATELSFEADACIIIHQKDPSGWWEGELEATGARGWLPQNYVQDF